MTSFTKLFFGIGRASAASMLGTGSSVELGWAKTVCDPVASLRSLARK